MIHEYDALSVETKNDIKNNVNVVLVGIVSSLALFGIVKGYEFGKAKYSEKLHEAYPLDTVGFITDLDSNLKSCDDDIFKIKYLEIVKNAMLSYKHASTKTEIIASRERLMQLASESPYKAILKDLVVE